MSYTKSSQQIKNLKLKNKTYRCSEENIEHIYDFEIGRVSEKTHRKYKPLKKRLNQTFKTVHKKMS